MKLKDKVAIVTGSSMGIGRAIARRLGQEGAKVVLNGRNGEKLAHTLDTLLGEGIIATACQGDISSVDDCFHLTEHALATYGNIDILVNNAGISAKGFFGEFQPDIFSKLVETNLLGSLYVTKAALPHIKSHQGNILFISSLSGLRVCATSKSLFTDQNGPNCPCGVAAR
ncbi:MAG: SDR family NAD(P)-dependent oxidoreductase [Saprospirales bacterium]|nr:SDR family NAD(P)-dependent oxidoreductase [Saprospirales bacterium]